MGKLSKPKAAVFIPSAYKELIVSWSPVILNKELSAAAFVIISCACFNWEEVKLRVLLFKLFNIVIYPSIIFCASSSDKDLDVILLSILLAKSLT